MHQLDWIVLGVFFLGLIGIIVWVLMKKEKDTVDYFLAGKNAGWLSIGSSIFASNIGSEHLVGLAGAGFISGMAMAHWEMHAWLILVLGWVFVPFYDRIKIFTMPEYLERRYSPGSRSILSIISLVSYVLTKVAVTVYAGGVVFKTVFNIQSIWGIDFFWISAIGLVVITGLYTIFGGMRAVMYTSVLQTPVLLIGSIVIFIVGLIKVGGWSEVERLVGPNLHLVRSAADPEFPWTGVLLASAVIGFWYWCTDQYIVQRVLSGKNQRTSRKGAILAGYFKLLPVFIFLIPGMIAFALNQKGLLHVQTSDSAFASMVAQLLPVGITGIVVCGLLAALMSSLASLFNSSAMLFVEDFYKKMKPDKAPRHYLKVGRIATAVIVVLGLIWIPVMLGLGKVLYDYLQNVQGLLAPAIATVFLFGVFWKRASAKGALWVMISGFSIGMFRLVLTAIYGAKTALVVGAEKYFYKLSYFNASLKDQILSGVHDLGTKVTAVMGGAGDHFRSLIDNAYTAIQNGSIDQASNYLASAKAGMQDVFVHQSGILYKIAAINPYQFTVYLFFFCILTMIIVSLVTKAPSEKQLQFTLAAATPEERAATRRSWDKWDVINTIIILSVIVAFYIHFW